MNTLSRLLTVVLLALVATGCAYNKSNGGDHGDGDAMAAAAPINDVCPVSGQELGDDPKTAEFNGQTVAFCCSRCASSWEKASDEKRAEMLGKVASTK